MSASAILNQAARVLRVVQSGMPADQALRETLTAGRHFSDPAGRRAVSRAVFAYFRWWRWLEPKDSLQKQLEAAQNLQARFDRNPAAIKPETLAARAVPEWVKDEIAWPESVGTADPNGPQALGGKRPYPSELEWLRQLQREPVLWIRTKRGLEAKVAAALGHCTPSSQLLASTKHSAGGSALSPQLSALNYTGPSDLYRTAAFRAGEFEIQDLASQLVGHACAPQPGETWWDTCAGEGGKTMHLADLMQGRGLIWASDRSSRRLAKLKERAARAKVFNYRAAEWDGGAKLPTKTKFDGVLIDAPCSGAGTWQRNPHARWTTTMQDVRELAAVQTRLLDHAASSLKPGGRLVYSVCTLTRRETTDVADAFAAAHPDFELVPVVRVAGVGDLGPGSTSPATVTFWPQNLNANGMFIAAWRKR